jgi:hypothetical protein
VSEGFEDEPSIRNQYLKLLDDKDKEIEMLNEYVHSLKQEF